MDHRALPTNSEASVSPATGLSASSDASPRNTATQPASWTSSSTKVVVVMKTPAATRCCLGTSHKARAVDQLLIGAELDLAGYRVMRRRWTLKDDTNELLAAAPRWAFYGLL